MFEQFAALNLYGIRYGYNQLKDFIQRQELRKMERGNALRNAVSSPEALKAYNETLRAQYIAAMGGIPTPSRDLQPRVTGVHRMDGYRVENILFSPRDNVWASAALYIPDGVTLPAPGILFLCGHSENGYRYPNYQIACQILVRSGLIVLALDPTGQGERGNYYDPETKTYLEGRATSDHSTVGIPAIAVGGCLMRYLLSDMIRAIDYMVTRPEIDSAKIGVTGISGGGTQAAALMMCDDRIAAAAPGCYITTLQEILESGMAQDAEQIFPAVNRMGYDICNSFLMMAPKPALILAANWDFFPIEGAWDCYHTAKRFYGLFGQEENMRIFTDDNGHGYSPAMAAAAGAFFNEVLLDKKVTVSSEVPPLLPEEILNATESGVILGSVPGAVSVPQEIRREAAALREARLALPEAERKERAKKWLAEQVYSDRKPVPFFIRTQHPVNCPTEDGYVGIPLTWWSQEKLFSYATVIRRFEMTDWNMPTVIAVWPEGTNRIPEHAAWIRNACDAGKQVLVLDAPGVGKTAQMPLNFSKEARARYAGVHNCANYLLYGGDSMGALLVYDAVRAVQLLKERFEIPEDAISFYCDGNDGVIGVMAGFLLDIRREYGENLMTGIEDAIITPAIYTYDNTLAQIIPGMLAYFDYSELM